MVKHVFTSSNKWTTENQVGFRLYLYYNLDSAEGGLHYSQAKVTTLINVLCWPQSFLLNQTVVISLGIQDSSYYLANLHFDSDSLEKGQKDVAMANGAWGENPSQKTNLSAYGNSSKLH